MNTVFLSALLFYLAFPNIFFKQGLFATGWLFAIPFFLSMERASSGSKTGTLFQRLGLGMSWGLLAYGALVWWLILVSVSGYVLFVLALALQAAFFAVLYRPVASFKYWSVVLFSAYTASAWVVSEFVRNLVLGGFTWSLGYSQAFVPELVQAARAGGVYAVSAVMVASSALVFAAYCKRMLRLLAASGLLLIPLVLFILGGFLTVLVPLPAGKSLRVAVVQPAISREDKQSVARYNDNAVAHLTLSKKAAFERRPDVICWPETSFPDDILKDALWRPRMMQVARNFGADMLFGSALLSPDQKDLNAYLFLDKEGQWRDVYCKRQLVPFTEYRPVDPVSLALMQHAGLRGNDFLAGMRRGLFTLSSSVVMGVALCSEEGYPALFRDLTRHGAGLISVALNDGWFVRPEALRLHQSMGILRAVETGRPLVRVANTGWSGVIDGHGRLMPGSVPLQKAGAAAFDVVPQTGQTLYVIFGDLFIYLCAAFVIIIIVMG